MSADGPHLVVVDGSRCSQSTGPGRDSRDLKRTASAYRLIAEMPAHCRPLAMLVCVERPYVFERNRQRWPDGLFHLLDRQYQPWHGHKIAHRDETLREIGVHAWYDSKAVEVAFGAEFRPLVDDVLQNFVRRKSRYLRTLAAMLDNLAERQRP